MNETLQTIRNRRSIRSYLPEQIKQEDLDLIIESAIYAPSGHNDQPWHFTIIQNKDTINYINQKSKEYLKSAPFEWMQTIGHNPNTILSYNAPTLIIISGDQNASSPKTDCCAAIQNILLAAESLNIGSTWIGLMKYFLETPDEAKKVGVPDNYKAYYCVALGYKANTHTTYVPKRKTDVVTYLL